MNDFKRTILVAVTAIGAIAVLADRSPDWLWGSGLGSYLGASGSMTTQAGQEGQGDQPAVSVLRGGDAWNGSTKRLGSQANRSGDGVFGDEGAYGREGRPDLQPLY